MSMPRNEVESVIRDAFSSAGLDPELGVAIGKHESGLNPDAEAQTGGDLARGGAYGPMQMTLATARGLGFTGEPAALKDPRLNAELAAKLVGQLSKRFPDQRDVISAYNSGQPFGSAPDVTRNKYVPGVLAKMPAPDLGPVESTVPTNLGPVEPATPAAPPEMAAFAAAHGDPEQATQALAVANRTGLSPQFSADALPVLQSGLAQQDTAAALARSPVLAQYAAQSPVHAAAVKDDLEPLSALEAGFLDLTRQYLARKYFADPADEANRLELTEVERRLGTYDKTSRWPVLSDVARMLPTVAAYASVTTLGGATAGPGGALAAPWILMYQSHVGELYRQLQDAELAKLDADPEYQPRSDKDLREFAKKGAITGATLFSTLGSVFVRALPFVNGALQKIGINIVSEAGKDTVVQAATRRLMEIGGHSLSGALAMAGQAAADDATVKKATTGQIDAGAATVAGARAFKDAIGPTLLLSAIEPGRQFLQNRGRIIDARVEVARLDKMAADAKASKVVQRAPEQAAAIIGKMAEGSDAATVYVDQAALKGDVAQAVADVAGTHAVAEAQATLGDVPIPIEVYLTQLDHATLREDVKLSADGMTLREAAATKPDATAALEALSPEDRAKIEPLLVGEPTAPTMPSAAALKDIARSAVEEKPIGQIRPDRYDAAVLKASREMVAVALERDKAAEGIVREYAKALDTTEELAKDAIAGARKGFYGAGMQAVSEGELGTGALREAGREVTTAERRLGKRSADTEAKLADLEAKHAANEAARQQEIDLLMAQQKFASEAAKAARERVAEMDRLETGLSRVDRDALARGDPAYLGAYDSVMGALQGQASPGALDVALARMASEARPLGFDEAAVAGLLANPRPWAKLTPPEARNLADAVASIRKAAVDANGIALGDRRATVREFVVGVREHLDSTGVPDKGPPPPSEAGIGRLGRARQRLGTVAAEMLKPEVILGRLGPGGEEIHGEFVSGRNEKERLAREVGDYFEKAYEKDMPKVLKKIRAEGVDGPGSPVVNDNKWVRQDLWTLAGWFGSESGAQRLRDGLRLTDEQIRSALEQLTLPEAKYIDSLHALHDEKFWPLIRDYEVATIGTSAPKIEARPFTVRLADGEIHTFRGGYWPAKRAGTIGAVPEGGIAGYWGSLRDAFPSTSKPFTEERADQTSYRPDLNWSSYAGHVNAVLHFLAYDPFVRNVGRVFQDPEFRATIEQRLGPQEMRELDKFVSVAARGKVDAPRDGANNLGQLIGNGFRSRVATGAFQLNLPIVVGQLSHIPATMFGMRIMPWHMLEGLGKALVPSTWADAHANSEQLPYRWNGYGQHMREMLAGIGPQDKPLGHKWLDAAGWSLYHAMDGFLSKTIWEAGRAKAEAAGLPEVAQYAAGDKAVSAMMPPLNIAEQASVVRDRGIIGSLLLVRNFPNTLYNVGAMNAWQARTGVWNASPGWQRGVRLLGGTTAAAAAYLGMTWSAHIFGRFLMGHGRQEDETTSDWLAREALTAPFYPLPFGEDIIAPLAQWATTDKSLKSLERGFRGAPPIAMLEHSMKDFAAAVDPNGTDTDKAFAAAKVAATALRLPLYPLKPARYFTDLFAGDVDPRGPLDMVGGAFYGERKPPYRQRNPATFAQDLLSGD